MTTRRRFLALLGLAPALPILVSRAGESVPEAKMYRAAGTFTPAARARLVAVEIVGSGGGGCTSTSDLNDQIRDQLAGPSRQWRT